MKLFDLTRKYTEKEKEFMSLWKQWATERKKLNKSYADFCEGDLLERSSTESLRDRMKT